MSFIKELDLFDKLQNSEDRVSSKRSFMLSGLFSVLCTILIFAEFISFIRPKIYRGIQLQSEVNAYEKVNISISIIVNMPCFYLHVDSFDTIGFGEMGPNTVSLRRLNKFGKFIGISNHSLADECVEDQLDIISFLMGKRPKPKTDCLDRIKLGISPDEKCLIKGKITVNKVRGIFHIAPGKNSDRVGSHIHDLSGRIPHFDLSHKIERIRFGPKIPTTYQPLEGVRLVQRSRLPIHYHYYVMATPVTYIKNGEIKDHGFDCTVIPSSTVSLPGMGNAPGLYFDYQFTPYTVVVRAESKRFFTYIAYTFAVLSGAFVITDLLSSYIWEEEDCEELLDDKIDK